MDGVENIYNEMKERYDYLDSQVETDEMKWRKRELLLVIVRLQQILLKNIKSK